jgi:glycosyltransferase involved in cell wall biosynthesis
MVGFRSHRVSSKRVIDRRFCPVCGIYGPWVRVYVYPADRTGCGFYRLIAPSEALRAAGHDVTVVLPRDRTGDVGLNGLQDEHGNLVAVQTPPDADVMVFQRITMAQLAQAVPLIRARGIAVVIDMDDNLTCIDPRNIAWEALHPRAGRPEHTWANATRACAAATLVTVSTPALLDTYAPHGRGVVVPNCVPASYLAVEHVDSDVIGWPGSVHSHPGDLEVVGSAVSRLVQDGHRFLAVGEGIGVGRDLGLPGDPDATGLVDLPDWPAAVARLGVGIAPLRDTKFNSGKSWLKPLEMAAVGVPWVASPRAEYQRLHRLGCGLLADKPNRWHRALRDLAGDPARRMELSEAGRQVATAWTIEGNAWRWAQAWADALAVQRQAASAFSTR